MFQVTFFPDELITVVHPEGKKVTRKLLEHPNATFVWGRLMDPFFIAGLLGAPRPFAPAHVSGLTRKPTREFFDVSPSRNEVVPGVVLFGLTNADMKKLNTFERTGQAMERHVVQVTMGQIKREVFMYLRKK